MKKPWNIFAVVFVICAALLYNPYDIYAKNKICDLYIINKDNKKVFLKTEIADTDGAIMRGLMYRNRLDENAGMLFVFKEEDTRVFWMRNTFIPLSIAYISSKGVINEIYDMKPLDDSLRYPSKTSVMFALEVNKDWFAKNNIKEGCRLFFNGCISK